MKKRIENVLLNVCCINEKFTKLTTTFIILLVAACTFYAPADFADYSKEGVVPQKRSAETLERDAEGKAFIESTKKKVALDYIGQKMIEQKDSNICQTPYGACLLPVSARTGTPCWCATPQGPVAGTVK